MQKSVFVLATFSWFTASAADWLHTEANVPVEITFTAEHARADAFNELTLDVTFTDPAGAARKVPAFWAGGEKWKVRYASAIVGVHRWRSECSDASDAGLH